MVNQIEPFDTQTVDHPQDVDQETVPCDRE